MRVFDKRRGKVSFKAELLGFQIRDGSYNCVGAVDQSAALIRALHQGAKGQVEAMLKDEMDAQAREKAFFSQLIHLLESLEAQVHTHTRISCPPCLHARDASSALILYNSLHLLLSISCSSRQSPALPVSLIHSPSLFIYTSHPLGGCVSVPDNELSCACACIGHSILYTCNEADAIRCP